MRGPSRWARFLVRGAGILFLAVVALELGARIWLRRWASEEAFANFGTIADLQERSGNYGRFIVHRHLGFALTPNYQRDRNRHNSLGFRGEDISIKKPEGTLRIACLGGSTTYGEGVAHDYRLSMPSMLQELCRADGRRVDVINAGCPGYTSLESLINFETRVLDLAPDIAIICHGINDVLPRLVWPPSAYVGDLSGWLRRDATSMIPDWIESSTLARILLVKSGRIQPAASLLRTIGNAPLTCQTFHFQSQRRIGQYPQGVFANTPIETMLAANPPIYFERNLRNFVAVARAHAVLPILATFAYSREFPEQPYIGHPAIQGAIDETNAIIRRLGIEMQVLVLDLAPHFTRKSLFTDGVHFTAEGNLERARVLQQSLASQLSSHPSGPR